MMDVALINDGPVILVLVILVLVTLILDINHS